MTDIIIPEWDEVNALIERGINLPDPLEAFVLDNEPAGEHTLLWRKQLNDLVTHVQMLTLHSQLSLAIAGSNTALLAALVTKLSPVKAPSVLHKDDADQETWQWQPMHTCPRYPGQYYDLWTVTKYRLPDCIWSTSLMVAGVKDATMSMWMTSAGKIEPDAAFTHWRLPPNDPEEH